MRNKITNNPLPVIFFTIFLDLLGLGILIPVIPQLLANPNSSYFLLPNGWTITSGYILLGFLTATFPFMQFLATPILGQLSDRYGRKKILLISILGTCVSYVLFGVGILTKSLPLLFIARGFDGITGGNIAVAQAAIADVTTPENRSKNFGLIGAAFGLGFIMGPYIGGKLSDPSLVSWFSATTPFWFAAILSGLNILSIINFFPETLKSTKEGLTIDWGKSVKNIIKAYSLDSLRIIFTTAFLFQGGFAFFTTFFSVFLINKFHFTQGNIGDFFSFVGLWLVFAQAVVTRFLASRLKEDQILKISIFGVGVVMLCFFLPNVWWQLLLVVPFFSVFMGLSQSNLVGVVSRSVDGSIQGEVLGINASVQALAQSIPPVLSGYIAASLTPESPILVSALFILLASLFFILFYRTHFYNFKKEDVQK